MSTGRKSNALYMYKEILCNILLRNLKNIQMKNHLNMKPHISLELVLKGAQIAIKKEWANVVVNNLFILT